MKLIWGLHRVIGLERGVVATIGNFDGVHLGHQAILHEAKAHAIRMDLPLLVILFEPQPLEFFNAEKAPPRLTSLREKLEVLAHCGVDYVYKVSFNSDFAETTAEDFVQRYLLNVLHIRRLLVGRDFRFGKGRSGDVQLLQTIGATENYTVDLCPDYQYQQEKVSSTRIRHLLAEGNLQQAKQLLGRTYSMCGRIIRGDGRGRQWGIPTANVALNRLNLPLKGVYAIHARIGGQMVNGVANIGSRPTVDGFKNVLEVHLFGSHGDLYGQMMKVYFLHKLRDEVKFNSINALIIQIKQDIEDARIYLQNQKETSIHD